MEYNRAFVPALLIMSLLLPAAALAGPRGGHRGDGRHGDYAHRRAPQEGFLTIRNQNVSRLEVLVDGKVVGDVDGMSTARFGPIDEGKHKVRVRFNRKNLRFPVSVQRMWIGTGEPARLVVPEVDVGIVRVKNNWVEPMTVVLNGRVVGKVAAHQKNALKIKNAIGLLEVRTPSGATAVSKRIRLAGLERDRLAVNPPEEGAISVFNPSRNHALDIVCARGSLLAQLPPRQSRTLIQPSGAVRLTARYRNQSVQSAQVLASPFERTSWNISLPTRSTLGVRNPNRFPVNIFVHGEHVATVAGQDKMMLENMPVGLVSVEVLGQGRRGGIDEVVQTRIDPLSGGFLPIPQMRVTDGRGGDCGSSGRERERSSYSSNSYHRGRRYSRSYASNRR